MRDGGPFLTFCGDLVDEGGVGVRHENLICCGAAAEDRRPGVEAGSKFEDELLQAEVEIAGGEVLEARARAPRSVRAVTRAIQ